MQQQQWRKGHRRRRRRQVFYDTDDDKAAESQLLAGLVSFRDSQMLRRQHLAMPYNTPAASFDAEFARELQSLRLPPPSGLEEWSQPEEGMLLADQGTEEASARPLASISTDMLLLEAERLWGRPQQQQFQQQQWLPPISQFNSHLNSHHQQQSMPHRLKLPTVDTQKQRKQQQAFHETGRLAYRLQAGGNRDVPDDAEIVQLLRSRSPTQHAEALDDKGTVEGNFAQRLEKHDNRASSPRGQTKAPATSVFSVRRTEDESAADQRRRLAVQGEAFNAASSRSVVPVSYGSSSSSGESPGELPSKLDVKHRSGHSGGTLEDSADESKSHLEPPNRRQQLPPKKSRKPVQQRRGVRRKVTGLQMLEGMSDDAATPSLASTIHRETPPGNATSATTDATVANRTTGVVRRSRRPADRRQDDADNGTVVIADAAAFSRECSCLSQRMGHRKESVACGSRHSAQRHRPDAGTSFGDPSERRTSSPTTAISPERATPHGDTAAETRQKSHQQQQLKSKTDPEPAGDCDNSEEDSDQFVLVRLPVKDQYRKAHCLAKTANLNAQLRAWLQSGGAPEDFFASRGQPAASGRPLASYFDPLPRYFRGLQLVEAAASTATDSTNNDKGEAGVKTRGGGRGGKKPTPGQLAYGGKNPDNYLPPHIVVKVQRRQ